MSIFTNVKATHFSWMKPSLNTNDDPEPEEQQTMRQCLSELIGVNGSNTALKFDCKTLMNRRFRKTNRAHLIKSLHWELSRESICFEAFRLSTVKKMAEGKLLVQQKPQAKENNRIEEVEEE